MIKLQDLTPEVYYKQSRDFQFIGRLYDIVLNYVKTNATNLYNLPVGKNMNEQLLNLLALTLGFKTTKNYNSKQLLAICSALPTILKHKGSINALVLAANALLAAEGVKQPLDYTIVPDQGITVYIAQEIEDLTLLTDLLDYLLPAGLSCELVKETQAIGKVNTIINVTDDITVYIHEEELLSKINHLSELSFGAISNSSGVLPHISIIPKSASTQQPSDVNNEYLKNKIQQNSQKVGGDIDD